MTISALDELNEAGVDALVSTLSIPPRPSLLQDLQTEINKEDPDPQAIARITSQDVALTAAVLKVVNSPFCGLRRRADSLSQVVQLLGLKPLAALVTGLVARQALKVEGPSMVRFWDVSTKRAFTMYHLSRKLRIGQPDVAQTFGLFCDLGIPVLLKKHPDYFETLATANTDSGTSFTDVERVKYRTDHALVGAIMAKTWGLSPTISLAIRLHHDYAQMGNPSTPSQVQDLIAMCLLSERIIQVGARRGNGTDALVLKRIRIRRNQRRLTRRVFC
jgi:HD-like signal output (HDOD) protein